MDRNLSRTTALTRHGNYLETWNGYQYPDAWVYLMTGARGGWIAETYPRVDYENPANQRRYDHLERGTPIDTAFIEFRRFFPVEDSLGDVLHRVPEPPRYADAAREFGHTRGLFSTTPAYGVDASGRFLVTRPSEYRIDMYDRQGRHLRSVRRPHEHVPIDARTLRDVAALVDVHFDTLSRLKHWNRVDNVVERHWQRRRMKALFEEQADFPLPPAQAVLGRIRVSGDGSFWVERRDAVPASRLEVESRGLAGPRPSRWDLFDADARFLGTVELPPKMNPYIVDGPVVTGVIRDDLDVEYVVTYRAHARGH